MKIKYTDNGVTKEIELKQGEKWSNIKTSTTLNSLFAKIDNGNGKIDQLELDALRLQMKVFNTDGNENKLSKAEQNKLKTLNWAKVRAKVQVAENLYDDIHAKTRLGTPTTGKNIRSHVYAVTTDNATTVFRTYSQKKEGKETLIGGIIKEYGLPIDERIEYAKYLVKTLAKDLKAQGKNVDDLANAIYEELAVQKKKAGPATSEKLDKLVTQMLNAKRGRKPNRTGNNGNTSNTNSTNNPTPPQKIENDTTDYYTPVKGLNGKIDKDFSQGKTGDCWLLSAIYAIAQSPKGLQILNDSVTIQKDGNVRVHLKGVNKTYIYTPAQIQAQDKLSSGDLDVRALEMAVNDYMHEHPQNGRNNIDGNHSEVAYQLLTGKGGKNFFSGRYGRFADIWFTDNQINRFNDPNRIVVVGRAWKWNSKETFTYECPKGQINELHPFHAYAVKSVDKYYVYLVNPWDTSKTIPVPRDEFKDFFNTIDEYEL